MKIINKLKKLIENKDLMVDIENSFKFKDITMEILQNKHKLESRQVRMLKNYYRGKANLPLSIKKSLLNTYSEFEKIVDSAFIENDLIHSRELARHLNKNEDTIKIFFIYYYAKTGRVFEARLGRPVQNLTATLPINLQEI